MTPAKLVIIILGLAFGHWSYLGVQAKIPSWKLYAARMLVENDLNHAKENKDNMLLLCVKQLEDYEFRTKEASELLSQAVLTSTDLKR